MVARNSSQRTTRLPSAAGALARLAFAHAEAAHVDVDQLLKKAGLTRQQMKNRDLRIAVRDQIRFVNLVADAVGDDCLGFNLAQDFNLREVGLLYYVMASSDRLIEALGRGSRYTDIVNEGIALTCRDAASLSLRFHYVGVSRHLDRHQMEFWMASVIRVCRQLTGLRLVPTRLRLAHRRGDCPAEFSEFFGGNIEFAAAIDEIQFDKRVGALPVVGADPYLNRLLVKICEETLSHRRGKGASFQSSVANAVAPLLPHGKARAGTIARELGVSPRTLARRLAAEDLTFSGLLQKLRADLARRYLADDSLSISQIAWLLGYREVGAFSHAFKRRTGKTPREARAA